MTKPQDSIFIEGGWYTDQDLPARLGGLWRPISEMPEAYKDGRELIVWDGDEWFKVQYERGGLWNDKGRFNCWGMADYGVSYVPIETVTHWMPTLPSPPRNDQEMSA